jgi:hypothetical protein
MRSKLPLLPSGPGGVRKSTFHGPWPGQCGGAGAEQQAWRGTRAGTGRISISCNCREGVKSETRNPKSEGNPKSELWPSLNPLGWPDWAAGMVAARFAALPDSLAQTRIWWQRFGFRISDFEFRILPLKGCNKPGCARCAPASRFAISPPRFPDYSPRP